MTTQRPTAPPQRQEAKPQQVEPTPPRETILPKVLRKSLIFISGVKGIGKSILAASLDIPDNIICFDFESKGELIHEQLGYGKYVDVISHVSQVKNTYKWKPMDLFQEVDILITKMERNRYTTLILDNIDPLQNALDAEVKAKALQYGLNPAKAAAGQFGENWKGVNSLVSNICQLAYSRGIRVIVIVSHVGHPWTAAGPDLRKWSVKGVETFNRLSCLSLILVPGNPLKGGEIDIPAAIVKKESLMFTRYDPEQRQTLIRRRVPYRFPQCTGQAIRDYVGDDPEKWFDSKNPRQGEMPDLEEMKPYQDIMTESEWKDIVRAAEIGVEADKLSKEKAEEEAGGDA